MTAVIAAVSSVLVAVLAGLFAYLNSRAASVRQDRLARVNAQLEELYGPLFALSQASNAVWRTFRERHRFGMVFVPAAELTEEQRQVWVRWIRDVFLPMNRRAYEVIVTKAHLLEGEEMPRCLLDFCAHVAGYEPVVRGWEDGDIAEIGSIVDHPGSTYLDYVRETFATLKKRQLELLRATRS
ncbi:MAG TPA: hypothetical protein VFV67_14240 [Actinophytocola sp.]|uniref:hypothetical protein n=1 Tax=Actinophytocola sp. TaxID=1872138 RepID=UPI002DBED8C0|nr:hypothetical protein [Actinophytocola sp.]HEU5471806.1 hypothetical protein [Actinophytocola sp.]